jgi:peptidoglycan-N-acetylglucosamine deacetylase
MPVPSANPSALAANAAVPAAPPGRWPLPPLITASIGLHALAAGSALIAPQTTPWALGAVLANHAALSAAGLWPRSALLGPNLRRLPDAAVAARQLAITIDDGPDAEVTPAVLDLLAEHGVRASFFCIAERAAALPALVRRMVAAGHSVQNHSFAHRHHFSLLGPRGFEREIGRAQAVIADITGTAPHCFRAPAGLRNPLLDPVLHRLNLQLVSWTRRGFDTREGDPSTVLRRLTRGLGAGDILLLHDGHARRTANGRPVVLEVLPPLMAALRAASLVPATLAEAVPPRHVQAVSSPSPACGRGLG